MSFPTMRQGLATWMVGMAAVALPERASAAVPSGPTDPAQVVPLDQIAPEHRENVAEVIRDHTFHRKGEPETFPCNPRFISTCSTSPR